MVRIKFWTTGRWGTEMGYVGLWVDFTLDLCDGVITGLTRGAWGGTEVYRLGVSSSPEIYYILFSIVES